MEYFSFYFLLLFPQHKLLFEKYILNACMYFTSQKLGVFHPQQHLIILYECQSQLEQAEPSLLCNLCKYTQLLVSCFFQFKGIDIFLISPRKHMLWILIQKCLDEYPQHIFHGDIRKIFTRYPTCCQVQQVFTTKISLSKTLLQKRGGYLQNIFLISLQKHILWYSLEVPQQGTSNEYCNMFL